MIDSTNPRQLADNIRKLWDKFKSISGDLLPSRSTATTGQILKLAGENKTPSWADEYSYTPPAYSETEVNTGRKWIDGKDIYCKVYSGNTQDSQTTETIDTLDYNFVRSEYYLQSASLNWYQPSSGIFFLSDDTNGTVKIEVSSAAFQTRPYIFILYYTKPDPEPPETRDDDTEPEEKKTTKKKTK